jgi:OFA family oxalate/formate antiporter-like MFS transporter
LLYSGRLFVASCDITVNGWSQDATTQPDDTQEPDVNPERGGMPVLAACCTAIFWPGAFIFGFPGVMAQYWQHTLQVDRAAIGGTLFFVLAAAGVAMFITGRLMRRFGPARLTAVSALLCGLSAMMVGRAAGIGMVYAWALLVGASSALIYLPALTVVQAWFPRRRGLVSGIVNMVFAVSAALMAPVFSTLLSVLGYRLTSTTLGLVALVAGLAAAPFMRFPSGGIAPPPDQNSTDTLPPVSLTASRAIRTRSFWFLWLIWAMAGGAGIAMVTLSIFFGLARGLPLKEAVLILAAFNLTNGLGRLISGYLSDIFGRNRTICLAFILSGLAYLLMGHLQGVSAWATMAALVGFGFGTQFAVSAPLISDCFGLRHFADIFGLLFTGYGFLAGILGPWLCGYLLDRYPGNFQLVFNYLGCFFLLSAVLIIYTRPPAGNNS